MRSFLRVSQAVGVTGLGYNAGSALNFACSSSHFKMPQRLEQNFFGKEALQLATQPEVAVQSYRKARSLHYRRGRTGSRMRQPSSAEWRRPSPCTAT